MSSARLSYRERREQAAAYRPIDPRETIARHRSSLQGLEDDLARRTFPAEYDEIIRMLIARYRDAIEVQEDNLS